jgi:deoxyribose-phosphate aldolase
MDSSFGRGLKGSGVDGDPVSRGGALFMRDLAAYIEHTLLRADATREAIERLCAEACRHRFCSVVVHGSRVVQACHELDSTGVHVTTVVGFPHGANDADVKRFEAEVAVDNGAHEVDMVLNIGRLREGDQRGVFREIRDVVTAADERPVKVILEMGLLTRDEIVLACDLAVEAGARYVKTSTGFGPTGARVEDVRLLRERVGPDFGVKAAGGIRDAAMALVLIEAGANRIGTSSGVALVTDRPA